MSVKRESYAKEFFQVSSAPAKQPPWMAGMRILQEQKSALHSS
jgi:hypothetical protein